MGDNRLVRYFLYYPRDSSSHMIPLRFLLPRLWLFLTFVLVGASLSAQVSFTASPTQGCSPLITTFTANAPGAVSYSWNLGNNTFSTLQNPSVTYVNGGLYNVTLTVSYANGSTASHTETGFIQVFNPPQPNFSAAPLLLCAGTPVTFQNLSQPGSGPILSYTWGFGDGTTNTSQNPSHIYTQGGLYVVTLIATDVNGCTDLEQKNSYVEVKNSPIADFTANNTLSCNTPFNVNFVTTTNSLGVAHFWSFGNGSTAITANPSTTYNTTGSYTVTHIMSDPAGCSDTVVKTNYIQVGSPTINFQVSTNNACVGQGITFSCGGAPGSIVNWNFGNGQTSNQCQTTVSYAAPGNYTATISITDPSGCTYNASQPITINPNPVVNFTVSDTLLCEAPHVVTFTSPNTAGSTYQWNFGDGTTGTGANPTHTYPTLPLNSATGQPYFWDVSLQVTNAFGCSSSLSKDNYVNTGQTNANILGVDRGGCAPRLVNFFDTSQSNSTIVSWQWDFGDNGATSTSQNPSHTYLDTGNYDITLIIETLHGCVDTFFAASYIVAGDTPIANFIADTTYACASSPIQFFNLSQNADSASWIFGDGGNTSAWEPLYQFVDTGFLSVMLIALDRGCPDTMLIDSQVYIDPPIAIFQPINSFGCELPHTVSFQDFSIGAQTWSWDFGDNTPGSTLQNPVHTYTQEGTFNTQLIVENLTTGCADTLPGQVRVELVEASFSVDTTFGCNPVVASFTDLSYKPSTWFWQFGNGVTSNQSNPTQVYNTTGQFDVRLFVVNSIGCFDDTIISKQISVYEPQVAFTAVPAQGCAPLSVTFTNNTTSLAPITNWQWSFGPAGATSTQQSPTFVYNNPGSWNVGLTATDSIGCPTTLIKPNAVFVSRPIANFVAQYPINCPNNPITFANSSTGSGLSYLWDFGDNTTSTALNPTHTYTANGSYTVSLTVTDFQGCDSTLVIPNYITIADPLISLLADTTNADCPPLIVNFTGNVISPHSFTTWNWDFGDGGTSIGQNPSHIYATPGSYTVGVTASAPSGCNATATIPNLININGPSGSFTISPTAVCPGVPITFTATSPDATIFTWDFNNGSLGFGQTTTYIYPASGVYLPLLILEDSVGCVIVVPNSQPVNIHPVPVASFNQSQAVLCDSGTVAFSNTSVSTAPVSSINWNFGLGLGTSQQNNPSFFFGQVGNYDVRLIVQNNFGCRDTALKQGLIIVGAPPTAQLSLSDTTDCAPFSVQFTDLSQPGSSPLASRLWTFSQSSPTFSSQTQPTFVYTQPGIYMPVLEVTDQNGCTDTDTLTLEALAPPVANFAADDSFGCAPKPIQFQSLTPNAVAWEWDFGDGSPKDFIDDPLHVYFVDGTYTVSMAVTDVEGCKDTLVKPQYIRLDHPVANFTVSDSVICPGVPLQFTDLSTSDTTLNGWSWRFGNGDQSVQQNPSYSYPASGLYNVFLKVRDVFGCEDSVTQRNRVRVKVDEIPVAPRIHYVSVFSASGIRIEFAPYVNSLRDFGSYRLLRDDGSGIWTPVFVSTNINDTVFVDQGLSTITQSYCYRLEVTNHCDRPSEPRAASDHCSILLESQSLVDAVELSWNAYQGWPVDSYYVYRVADYSSTLRLMTVLPGSTTTWTDLDMFCYDANLYRVRATQQDGPWESWSNLRREAPQHFGPPFPLHMQTVTVEQDSFLLVKWSDIPPGDNLVQMVVEKDAGNGFQFWHSQTISDPMREKPDFAVNVHLKPYTYQAFVIDTCGDVTPAGYFARSIFLQATKVEGSITLDWTPYDQWENGIARYEIELYDQSNGQFILIATVDGGKTEYLDQQVELPQGTYCYRIVAYERGGNRQTSVSNESCVTVDPLLYFPNAFSPNGDGNNEQFLIKGAYIQNFYLEIYNRWGEKVFVTTDQASGWNGTVNNVPAPEGVYVFSVVGTGFEGEEIRRSGTVTLFR